MMKQRTYAEYYRPEIRMTQGVTMEEYCLLHKKKKVRWRFKPKSAMPLFVWALLIFVVFKILLFPLAEGIIRYTAKTKELNDLKQEYQALNRQVVTMTKARNYMMTPAYIEERGHQIGMVKANETQMVVIDAGKDEDISALIAARRKPVEIGD